MKNKDLKMKMLKITTKNKHHLKCNATANLTNENKGKTYFVQFQVDVLLLLKQRRGLTLIWSPH